MSGAITAVAAVAGAVAARNSGQDQEKAAQLAEEQPRLAADQQARLAERAQQQTEENARKQQQAADEATNRANQKRAGTGSVLDAAREAGRAGASGTMLTGPTGISPDALQLGKTTLLGS